MTEQSNVMAEAVARGVALLDDKRPGWWQKIDVAELEMDDCSQCVLGQLFQRATNSVSVLEYGRAYGDGLGALGIVDGREFGFDLSEVDFNNPRAYPERWDALRELWVEVIKRRYDEGFDV